MSQAHEHGASTFMKEVRAILTKSPDRELQRSRARDTDKEDH